MPKHILRAAALALVAVLAACGGEEAKVAKTYDQPPPITIDTDKRYLATLETNKGSIIVDLLAAEAPKTVNSFVFLATDGFYDGVTFHRIVKGFMIQGGDPTGSGGGGPGYTFEDEPVSREYLSGTVAMANRGPNTNGSQFFIMHGQSNLPKHYTIFGLVTEGMDVVDSIASTPVVISESGELSKPTENVIIHRITIEETP